MRAQLYPLQFNPVYKDYIWGGDKIKIHFSRDLILSRCAESWEISDRDDDISVVQNGVFTGKTLQYLMKNMSEDILGIKGKAQFPLLIKIIDAAKPLSIQVHPNENSSKKYGGEAKTEAWYFLDADRGASVYTGTIKGTTPEQFKTAIKENKITEFLQHTMVTKGDVIYVPGGRIHSIGAGCLILEVQQNSNTTYRVYDWERLGAEGKPRKLHIKNAFNVINWSNDSPQKTSQAFAVNNSTTMYSEILKCPYFLMHRLVLNGVKKHRESLEGCHILFCVRGNGTVSSLTGNAKIIPGSTTLIPASLKKYTLIPKNQELEIIKVVPTYNS